MSVCLSVCLSVYLSVCLSLSLSTTFPSLALSLTPSPPPPPFFLSLVSVFVCLYWPGLVLGGLPLLFCFCFVQNRPKHHKSNQTPVSKPNTSPRFDDIAYYYVRQSPTHRPVLTTLHITMYVRAQYHHAPFLRHCILITMHIKAQQHAVLFDLLCTSKPDTTPPFYDTAYYYVRQSPSPRPFSTTLRITMYVKTHHHAPFLRHCVLLCTSKPTTMPFLYDTAYYYVRQNPSPRPFSTTLRITMYVKTHHHAPFLRHCVLLCTSKPITTPTFYVRHMRLLLCTSSPRPFSTTLRITLYVTHHHAPPPPHFFCVLLCTSNSIITTQRFSMYVKAHHHALPPPPFFLELLIFSGTANGVQAVKGEHVIGEIMDTWTRQMGYPMVTVEDRGDSYHLTQTRFLLHDNGSQFNISDSPYG